MAERKPNWLKVRAPGGERYTKIKARARQLKLHTVCEEAHCPNVGECWGSGTATFMVMGGICTRGCRFCAVDTRRKGMPLDPDEPRNVANAIAELELDYVVVTSVDRDDLPDQGSGHFASCIREIRRASPRTLVEVLIPDFSGSTERLQTVFNARPDVIAHNIECVRRITRRVRDRRASYDQSLKVLADLKLMDVNRLTKSSIMVGVGETEEEVITTMGDLRAVGCNFLTIGQYLRPTGKHLAVETYVPPEVFDRYKRIGEQLGFAYVASGPLVRSSYKAGEFFITQYLRQHRSTSAPMEARP